MPKRKLKAVEAAKVDEEKPMLDSFVATRRQSARSSTIKAKQLIIEQNQDDSEDSDDAFVPPPTKMKKKSDGVVIQSANSFLSSASSDDSNEKEKETKPKKKTRAKKLPPVVKSAPAKSSRAVLSSDSDSDFEDVPVQQKFTSSKVLPTEAKLTSDDESDLDEVQEEETDLHQLFPLLSQNNEAMKSLKNISTDTKKEKTKNSTMDVSQLLAMGETQEPVASTSKTKSKKSSSAKRKQVESDESDWEEVDHREEHLIPREGVEVKIEAPDGMRKKKTKTLDMQAIIKRRINQIRREKQVELHKASLLCHLSHGMIVSRTLNSPSVMAVALSILPSQHCYPPKKTDIAYLEKVTAWFKKKVVIAEVEEDKNLTLMQVLEKSFTEMKAPSKKLLVFMFVAMLRSLGVKTRLIISLQPLPLKLSSADLLAVSAKPEPTENKKEKKENDKKSEKPKKVVTKTVRDTKLKKESKPPRSKRKEGKAEPKSKKPKKETESKYFSQGTSSSSPDVDQKIKSLRSRKSNKYKEESSEESEPESKPTKKNKTSTAKPEWSDEEDFKPEFIKMVKNSKIKVGSRKVLSTDSERSNSPKNIKIAKNRAGNDFWAEVFVEMEEKWISVDVLNGKVHCVEHLNAKASTQLLYIMGFGQDQSVRDLTRRYCPQFYTSTRKQRVDQDWWDDAIVPFYGKKTAYDKEEEGEIERQLQDRPIPKTLSELKNHPLYVLKRHLLKFEGIYPPDAPPLGFFKDEPIFARECVFTMRSRETWLKEAKVVKLNEQPYKVVKARPKYDRMSGQMKDALPLEIFGPWQTEDYVPPAAKDGKVPRNEYGNVELFKPCMLPEGTVHLKISTLNKTARKLGIDCAPAMVGFDFHSGGCHPVFEGVVVCEEFKDTLLDAHRQEEEEKAKRGEDKRLKRIYGNWRKLINGLLIREKLLKKYDFSQKPKNDKKPAKKLAEASCSKKASNKKM